MLILMIGLTFLLAGLVKGVTGMGLPTVAMGLLGALISPLAAASLLIVPSFVTNLWQLIAGGPVRGLIRRFAPMMLAIFAGTFAGSFFMVGGAIRQVTGALGVVLAAYALYALLARPRQLPARHERWLSPLVGMITGLVSGATGVFVVPAVPYIQSLGLEKDALVQALGLSFTVSTVALAASLVWHGAFQADNLIWSSAAVLPALAGMGLGQALRRRVSPAAFRRGFLICLLLLGLEMALRPLI